MKILYLYAEVMGYTMATVKALVGHGAEVHIVHWDQAKQTPYQIDPQSGIYNYKLSALNKNGLQDLAKKLDPHITVVSGWMNRDYLATAQLLKSEGKLIVLALDSQWYGNLRQYLAVLMGKLRYFSRYYSHAWVPGNYQFEYVRRLGFSKTNIIYDLLSADLSLFNSVYDDSIEQKQKSYPHRFLFVGRFESIKGLNTLLNAWQQLGDSRGDWELHLIGNGSLQPKLQSMPGIVVKDFMQPHDLIQEVAQAGCFVLPSYAEPWGVVVHEFAAAGLPLLLSDVVGAASTFLISGFNGYQFKVNNPNSLVQYLSKIIATPDQELLDMARTSHHLSQRITPETSAMNLLSLARANSD